MVQTFCFCGVDPSIFSLFWCESAVGQHVNFNPPPPPSFIFWIARCLHC